MTDIPINQQAEVSDGNSVFDDVWILNKLHYDFTNSGTITISNLNVIGISTFTGDISVDEITVRNVDVTGIATVGGNLYVGGGIADSTNDFGTSGEILESTGSGTRWIPANTTSVANAINVGVTEVSDSNDKFVSFFNGNSGNLPNQVDANLKYNASTNVLSAVKFSGDGSLLTNIQAGQVQGNSIFVSGMIILWSGTIASIPTGFVLCDGQNNTPDLRDKFIIGAREDNSGVAKSNIEGSLTQSGGSKDAIIVSHDHTVNHNHGFTTGSDGAHSHSYTRFSGTARVDNDETHQRLNGSTSDTTGSAGSHSHSGTTNNSNPTTSSSGSSSSNANLPPYFALAYIMKT
mgnify:FL=1